MGDEFKCAFNHTLLGGQFGCAKAKAIVRRGGPDMACTSEEAHRRCATLFDRLKSTALPTFGVEDDLLTMPHSVLVKIQFGGLLGLQQRLTGVTADEVKDVYALVSQAGDVETADYSGLAEAMTGYRLKRRR